MNNWKIHVCSENNFPTAAGLASSAAGYACLAVALAKLYKIEVKQKLCSSLTHINFETWKIINVALKKKTSRRET